MHYLIPVYYHRSNPELPLVIRDDKIVKEKQLGRVRNMERKKEIQWQDLISNF